MMFSSRLQQFNQYRKQNQDTIILYANYLMIAYAFFLPIYNSVARVIFSFILVLFLLSGNLKEKLMFALKDKVVIAFVLYYLLFVIWLIGSEHMDIGLDRVHRFKAILYIIVYVAMMRKDFVYKILTAFLLGISFSEMVSYLMLFDIRIPYLVYNGHGTNVPFMESYTQYSAVLSISLGILFYGIITVKQHKLLKIIYILFFISASSNIFIIQSKLGYGLYGVSILTVTFMIILKYKKYWMIPLSLFLIFGGYYLAYNTSKTFHNRVSSFFNQTKAAVEVKNYHTSTGVRIGFNKYGYELILQNPVFGLGTADQVSGFLEYVKDKEHNSANYQSFYKNTNNGTNGSLHSEFLDNGLQFGILGLLVFLNIFYQLFRYQHEDYYMKIVQIIFVVILLSVSSVSLIFVYPQLMKIFIFLSAMTLNLYHNQNVRKIE